MQHYGNNVVAALQHVYPEIDIDEAKFVVLNRITIFYIFNI